MGIYTPYTWEIGVGGGTPIDKTNLDHLETQYDAALTSIHKTADQIVNNSNVLVNDTHLLFPVGANEVWSVFLYCRVLTTAAADFKYAFAVPAGGSLPFTANHLFMTWGGAFLNNILSREFAVQQQPAVQATVDWVLLVWGVYIGGANAGNVQFQWSQQAAEATNTTVYKDSYIIARQIA